MPNPKELFNELVMTSFEPLRKLIEYGDYDEILTSEDIAKVMRAVEQHTNNYVEFLRMAKKDARGTKIR